MSLESSRKITVVLDPYHLEKVARILGAHPELDGSAEAAIRLAIRAILA